MSEIEFSVIGGVLLDNSIFPAVEYLETGHFTDQRCQIIWGTIRDMLNSEEAVDLLTLSEKLKMARSLDASGGMSFLVTLFDYVPNTAHTKNHAKILDNNFRKRLSIKAVERFKKNLKSMPITEAILDVQERLTNIIPLSEIEFKTTSVLVKETFKEIELIHEGKIKPTYTCFVDIDKVLGGFLPGTLNVIAARPSMGKTALALNIAVNIARKEEIKIAIFSLETIDKTLMKRLIASESKVDSTKLFVGGLGEHDFPKLLRGVDSVDNLPIFWFDASGITVTQIKSKVSRLENVGLVIIDYLQLILSRGKTENRVQEIGKMTRELKCFAMEFGFPIICISQLNRKLEERTNKRPMLSDLRESGTIEQDADSVMFIYRPEVYKQTEENYGKAEIIIAKNKNGQIGTAYLAFFKEFTRFENLIRGK
jgi:replicative DNA helicase